MNDQLQKQLIRQLKLLNFWITTFGITMLIALAIIGYFLFQTVMFVKSTSDNLQSVKQQTTDTLNVNKQVCDGNGALSNYVKNNTNFCN
jgi:CHASE3 domain sensor protein